jgi:diguanylate cyclase (GGDEF)-like protein
VLASEEKLEKAIKASRSMERDRRQRLLWTAATASSYAFDALILGLFVAAGTVPASVFYFFAAGAAAICAVTYAVYARGWNLKLRDQNVIWPQTGAAVVLHLGVVALAPQATFPLLANLFTVFAFGLIWLSLRTSVVMWALSIIATGAILWTVGDRAAVAASSPFEVLVTWLCFSAIMGRCLVLSVYANDLRTRLAEGRRRLAASLEQIRELVHYDELTRIYNRRTLIERLEQERSRAVRTGVPFCVALFDLDHFKAVNDNHGHAAGDAVLKGFAAVVRASMRDSDVFGRYGGEEFMLILNATVPAAAQVPLERIRTGLAAHEWAAIAPGLALTASIGVAGFRAGEAVAQLLNRADSGLYEAKRAGRNCVVIKD